MTVLERVGWHSATRHRRGRQRERHWRAWRGRFRRLFGSSRPPAPVAEPDLDPEAP